MRAPRLLGEHQPSVLLMVLLYSSLALAWVVASRLVLVGSGTGAQGLHPVDGVVFVGLTGLLLVVLAVREVLVRRELERALRETSAILTSVELLTAPSLAHLPLDELVRELLSRVLGVVDADAAALLLVEGDRLVVTATHGLGRGTEPVDVPFGRGVAGRIAATGEPIVVDDIRTVDALTPGVRDHLASLAGAPLVVDGRVVGVLLVGTTRPRRFQPRDVQHLQLVADRTGAAIERSRLHTETTAVASRLAALVEASPIAILELAVDGTVQRWNRAAATTFAWPNVALDPPTLHAETAAHFAELQRRTAAGRVLPDVEFAARRSNGDPFHAAVAVAPLPGREGGMLAMVADITERKTLERQLQQAQRIETMGRVAGGIAHDFNNLLTVIVGYTSLLLRQFPDTDPVGADLRAVLGAAERGAELTTRLLTIGRQRVAEAEVIDPKDAVGDLLDVVRHVAGGAVTLDVDLASTGNVRMAPGTLDQVVLNLVVNARDAMPAGGTMRVSTRDAIVAAGAPVSDDHRDLLPGRYVVVTVSDTGVGMDADTLARATEPFFTTKGRAQGTGLGLATVDGISIQYGCTFRLTSAPGHGTTAQLWLPWVDAPVTPHSERPPTAAPTAGVVLLLDDEDEVRQLSRRVLEHAGFTVLEAASGPQAVSLVERHPTPIDVLVSDVVMPGMNGVEVAHALTALRPAMAVLFVSAYADDAGARATVGRQDHFLAKPFRPEDLVSAVHAVIPPRSSAVA